MHLNAMSKLSSALSIKMLKRLVVKGSNVRFLPRIPSCPLCISLVSYHSKRTIHPQYEPFTVAFPIWLRGKHMPTIATAPAQKSYQRAWVGGPLSDTLMAQFEPTVIASSTSPTVCLALEDRNLLPLIVRGSCWSTCASPSLPSVVIILEAQTDSMSVRHSAASGRRWGGVSLHLTVGAHCDTEIVNWSFSPSLR